MRPCPVEVVVLLCALRFVPVTLVHLDHPTGMAGDTAVGEELDEEEAEGVWVAIGRVGKNHVETTAGILGGSGVEKSQTVALIQPEAISVVAINAVGNRSDILRAPNVIHGFAVGTNRHDRVFKDNTVHRVDVLGRFGVTDRGVDYPSHVFGFCEARKRSRRRDQDPNLKTRISVQFALGWAWTTGRVVLPCPTFSSWLFWRREELELCPRHR